MENEGSAQHRVIARVHSPYPQKFGVPRQSGLVPEAKGEIIFEPEFRQLEALRGLEAFSHIWLVFGFHLAERQSWKATVRPPRLGGNERVGVFATRSPFRPNSIGLSVVSLEGIEEAGELAPKLRVGGLDLVDQTPIFDIKPYLPYADSIPQAQGGFANAAPAPSLKVRVAQECQDVWGKLSDEARSVIERSLSLDPRPAFQEADRVYRLSIASYDIACRIADGICTIIELEPAT